MYFILCQCKLGFRTEKNERSSYKGATIQVKRIWQSNITETIEVRIDAFDNFYQCCE